MKKLFILMLCMILLVGSVSAFQLDQLNDRLVYSNNDLKVSLENWWGLGKTIGTAELKSHKSVNEVLQFGFGKEEVVMYYDFNFSELYVDGLGEVTFTDQKTGKEIQKDYSFVEWVSQNVTRNINENILIGKAVNGTDIYENQITGTYEEEVWSWERLETNDIPNGNFRIGLRTYVGKGDYIDAVWKIAGKKVTKHSEWTASLNINLEVYWKLNESSGNLIDSIGNVNLTEVAGNPLFSQPGLIGTAIGFNSTFQGFTSTGGSNLSKIDFGTTADYSFSFWINITSTLVGFPTMLDTNTLSSPRWAVFGETGNTEVTWRTATTGAGVTLIADGGLSINEYHMVSGVRNNSGTDFWFYIDAVLNQSLTGQGVQDASATNLSFGNPYASRDLDASIDEFGIWSRELTQSELTDLFNGGAGITFTDFFPVPPVINLDSPENNTNFTLTNQVVMNATIFDSFNITNVTLYLNNVGNETNTTAGLNNTIWTFTKNMGEGDTFWTMEACNFDNVCVNSSEGQRLFNVNTTPDIQYEAGVPVNEANITTNFFNVNVTITEDLFKNITFDLYNRLGTLNQTVTFTNSSRNQNWTNLPDADYSYNVTIATTTNQFNSTETRNISIDTTPFINYTDPTPINGFNTTNDFFAVNVTITEEFFQNITFDLYNRLGTLNQTVTFTNSSRIQNWTNLLDADYSYNVTIATTTNQFNSTETRNISVDSNFPIIIVTSPVGDQGTFSSGLNLSLIWNANDINIDVCQFDYEGSNTTVNCNNTEIGFIVTDSTATSLIFYVNDTFGQVSFNSTSWTYSFIENNVTFNPDVFETDSQFFQINLSTSLNVSAISAQLNYNGTNFISEASCEDFCLVNNTIDIPLVTSGEFENKSFFWEISIFNGTDSINVNTSSTEQNITRIHLEECGGAFTTEALNFTVYDEQNLSRLNAFLFDGDFEQWLGTGTVKRQSNFSQSSTSDLDLCISPTDETFFIDATIEYDEAGNESLYTLRNYYFQNDTINNVSEDIFMYLLQSSFSTSFILKVQDDALLPVAGVLIETNRFYPGLNEFRIVQIAKTDDLGKSVGFFETEIVDYKFLITFNNNTLLETGIQKVIPETSPFTLTFNLGANLGEPWSSQIPLGNLISTLIWDNTLGIITYTYEDNSTNLTLARLFVIQQSLVNSSADSTLCNVNSSLDSAILTCDVGNDSGFYTASAFISRNSLESLDLQISFQIETLSGVVGLLGLFYGWFLILIASFMFKFNEIAGIWAITIVVLLVNIMGLINFGGVFTTATIGVAILLTWLMSN